MPDSLVSTKSKVLDSSPSLPPQTESVRGEVWELIRQIGPGKMANVAYDTAWVARLGDADWDLSSPSLAWLNVHQLRDGCWGAQRPFYYHDRLISSLAAMIALAQRGRRDQDRRQLERGLQALEAITARPAEGLQTDSNGATVGFEMIAPTLVAEAERLGIIRQRSDRLLGRIGQYRAQKLAHLHGKMINRRITAAFSAEMAGVDGQQMLDLENLQEGNGSVGCSPSATAYLVLQVDPDNPKALHYLHQVVSEDGGAPNVAPFDTFETAWALWNLALIPGFTGFKERVQQHVEALSRSWDKLQGAGFSSEYSVNDADGTSMVFDALSRYGVLKSMDPILHYEEQEWFKCFELENDPSISANIHVLDALRQAGLKKDHPSVGKILHFLQKARSREGYWLDKWHISPYYTSSHAIIACAGYANEMVLDAVEWLIQTQHPDGSWGIAASTAEETAYALQALWLWDQGVRRLPREIFRKGRIWLEDHQSRPYDPLWVGKCLYCPKLVIDSAVISALCLMSI